MPFSAAIMSALHVDIDVCHVGDNIVLHTVSNASHGMGQAMLMLR